MLWVGAIVLVLGVAFFLKYAFDNEWITESMRVALGVLAGAGLIVAGQRSTSAATRAYGQIVTGGGLAVLFLAIYAAFSFYGLIGQTTTFALLVMVTAGAAALADRQRALGLALMAVGGGFATPFLVGGGVDAQLTLFTYDALLVVGTLYLANRQGWPSLNALSFLFTVLHHRRLDGRVLGAGQVGPHRALPHALLRPVPADPARAARAARLASLLVDRAGHRPAALPRRLARHPGTARRGGLGLPDCRDDGGGGAGGARRFDRRGAGRPGSRSSCR